MAGHGGGAWKVAYADFITAMMAFFLVMWIVGQDQKIRRSVADYFSDPLGNPSASNNNKRASRTGSINDSINTGAIPMEDHVVLGQGKVPFSSNRKKSPSTNMVYNWIQQDATAHAYWQKQVKNARETARWSSEVKDHGVAADTVAIRTLSRQLQEETMRGVPRGVDGIQRDLLLQAILEVNWPQIAEELINP